MRITDQIFKNKKKTSRPLKHAALSSYSQSMSMNSKESKRSMSTKSSMLEEEEEEVRWEDLEQLEYYEEILVSLIPLALLIVVDSFLQIGYASQYRLSMRLLVCRSIYKRLVSTSRCQAIISHQ